MTTIKNELIKLISDYTSYEATDERSKIKTLEFIKANEVIFGSENPLGHVTASSWLINYSGDSTLLTHHKKLNLWLQLGGHTETNENIFESAMRETKEESGLSELQFISLAIFDIDVHEIPERKGQAAHYHYDIRFLMKQTADETIAISDESNDLKWVKHQDVYKLTSQRSVTRMADKFLAFKER